MLLHCKHIVTPITLRRIINYVYFIKYLQHKMFEMNLQILIMPKSYVIYKFDKVQFKII
jgi:hypothetical protein